MSLSEKQEKALPYEVWECKIVIPRGTKLPPGFDLPPRVAAMEAVEKVAAGRVIACFSGWGGTLTKMQREIADEDYAKMQPKPEPKRGVEEMLSLVVSGLEDIPAARDEYTVTKEALRLYREERERVAKVVAGVRDEAKWLEAWLGKADSGAYLGCVRRLGHLCTRLERGE